jgi:hypothetical protein
MELLALIMTRFYNSCDQWTAACLVSNFATWARMSQSVM